MNAKEIEQAVSNKLAEWGIEYIAEFVPQSRSRFKNEKQLTLNWEIGFQPIGTKAEIWKFRTEYAQGIGHVPRYDAKFAKSMMGDEYFRKATETGKYNLTPDNNWSYWKPLPIPKEAAVLYSLLLDDEARNYTFEDWADNFGYDTDSRKAEAIYRECIDIGIRLRYVFTQAQLDELAKLLEDY